MKQFKRLPALFLCIPILAALLAGCSSRPAAEASPAPAAEEDIVLELTGLPRDTVVFTVDGADVIAEEYLFFLARSVSYMDQYAQYMGQTGINWEDEMSGLSIADYCKNEAMTTAKLYALVELHAADNGVTMSDADTQALQAELDNMVEQTGGQEQYALWLSRMGLSQAAIEHLSKISYLYQDLQDALYGEGGQNAPTDESMDEYIAENDLLSAKHILLLTVDMNDRDSETGAYASLDADTITQKRALADQLEAQLRENDDPISLFDTLMNEYSEDSGLSSNPDGYSFTAGDMVPAFETATRTLAFGEISDVVESEYGYHIILRQDPDTEALRSDWISSQMDALMEDWVTNAEVVTNEAYDSIDPQDYYTKLLAHQADIDALLNSEQSNTGAADSNN